MSIGVLITAIIATFHEDLLDAGTVYMAANYVDIVWVLVESNAIKHRYVSTPRQQETGNLSFNTCEDA